MRFNCGLTKEELEAWLNSRCDWHKKFAWFPVRIRSGLCVWLEHYEAKYSEWKLWYDDYWPFGFGGFDWRISGLELREVNRDKV